MTTVEPIRKRTLATTDLGQHSEPPVSSPHLCEDTMNAGDALVTLSTFYDGTLRKTRSVLVAHTDPVPGTRRVLASFELDSLTGPPDAEATAQLHHQNANRVAHMLTGDDSNDVEHGDLIRSVLDTALGYDPNRVHGLETSAAAAVSGPSA